MDHQLTDIDGKLYYTKDIDPHAVFNKLEITLSHLFRSKMDVLGGRNYSDCVADLLIERGYLQSDVVEIGCGIGDLAINLLRSCKERGHPISRYSMVDISPAMLRVLRERLGDAVQEYILADCLELASVLKRFDGMILSNAMIADLRAVRLEPGQRLADVGIDAPGIDRFASEWTAARGPRYIHVGPLGFLEQLHRTMTEASTAVILEYSATDINQPSLFFDEGGALHTKCGIEFPQIVAYAERLGFQASVVPIEDVFGIPVDQEFLSVDVFTRDDVIAGAVAVDASIRNARAFLPVLAYTRRSLEEALSRPGAPFSSGDIMHLLDKLNPCFFPVRHPRFDTTNPTTWGYACLLLRKKGDADARRERS